MTRNSSKRSSEAVRCPICWDQLVVPLATPCGHTFCAQCIRSSLNARKECPVCRAAISTHRALRDAKELREAIVSAGAAPTASQPYREVSLVTAAPPADSWNCTRCTMLNAGGYSRCTACASRRRSEHRPVGPSEQPRFALVAARTIKKKRKGGSGAPSSSAHCSGSGEPRYRIDYDDGDVEDRVPAARIRGDCLAIGATVTANWRGRGHYYAGTIAAVHRPGSGDEVPQAAAEDMSVAEPASSCDNVEQSSTLGHFLAAWHRRRAEELEDAERKRAEAERERHRDAAARAEASAQKQQAEAERKKRDAERECAEREQVEALGEAERKRRKDAVARAEAAARKQAEAERKKRDAERECAEHEQVEALGEVPEWVAAAAQREGLTLIRSATTATGFKHVSVSVARSSLTCKKPFQLRMTEEKAVVNGGRYATAAEAALAYARSIGAQASAMEAQQLCEHKMTSSQAIAAAEAEGLTLVTADNQAGYRHVHLESSTGRNGTRPYRVRIRGRDGGGTACRPRDCLNRGGEQCRPPFTGMFASAEEAALEVARYWAKYP
jgi:flagellar biosynthesis GTPase FlhF